jgi:large subunit ribosomal protein L30
MARDKKTGKEKPGEQKKKVKITLVVSPIGFNEKQGRVVQSMGLRRIRHSVELVDTPETRGMIHKVRHLVRVEQD